MDSLSPAYEVREAVYSLGSLMYRAQREQDKALPYWEGVEPVELSGEMKQLESGLHQSSELLRAPKPGQGLSSLYVRLVATHFARFEEWRLSQFNGWGDALWENGNGDLDWLGLKAPGLGTDINGWDARGPSGVARLLEPGKSSLDRLREKAADWAAAFVDAPDQPQGVLVERELLNAWAPWEKKRIDFSKACGRLVIEAVDQCEIPADLMKEVAFAEATLSSLGDDGSRLLLRLCGKGFGGNEVLQLAEKLTEQTEPAGKTDFIEGLLAGPSEVELTAKELALLNAHLRQRQSMTKILHEQRTTGESETLRRREKLKLIRDYNRNLQELQTNSDSNLGTDADCLTTPPEPPAGDAAGAGECGLPASDPIEQLEKETPKLDRENGQWLKNTKAAAKEGIETRTLAKYRTEGQVNSSKSLGRDKGGRVWRRDGTPSSHPWYLKSSLPSSRKP